ncbi:hypothetical protein A3760_18840 [Oleiphilus sp. HI0122]|nr:hypothetical protein A3760_18840 [Oleiphilus sp. HI0122]
MSQDHVLPDVLDSLRFDRFLLHCSKQALHGQRALAAFDDWFDAFTTLKFVHACRDLFYEDLPLGALIEHGAELPADLLEQYNTILMNWSA